MTFEDFIARWTDSSGAERANKDAFLGDLCRVLGVDAPHPTTGDPERDTYVFEKDVVIPLEDGKKTIGRIDLYKHGFFILEAKQGSPQRQVDQLPPFQRQCVAVQSQQIKKSVGCQTLVAIDEVLTLVFFRVFETDRHRLASATLR